MFPLQVFNFELSREEMARLASLERGVRANNFQYLEHRPEYPYRAEF